MLPEDFPPPTEARMSLSAVAQQLDRLTRLPPGKHPIVSCYLKLEPRDRSRGKYLIKLKNRARTALDQAAALGFGRAAQEAVAQDLERVQDALRNPGALPAARGVAVFASSGLNLFEVIPLPWVYRSRLVVDRTPLVRELLAVEDEVGRLMTVVLDGRGARIFEVTAFGTTEASTLAFDGPRGGRFHSDRRDAPGMGEHTYHNRIRAEKQRHLSAVADAVFALDRRRPVHGLVLAGIGTDAGAVEPFLHPYLRGRVMGAVKLNLKKVSPAAVHEATLQARADFESRAEAAAVEEVGRERRAGHPPGARQGPGAHPPRESRRDRGRLPLRRLGSAGGGGEGLPGPGRRAAGARPD
jgi:peptide chain release factor subunit 1